jgi:hypothetical protein
MQMERQHQFMEGQGQFTFHDLTGAHVVKPDDVSPFLSSLSPIQLQKYTDAGYRIRAIKMKNGDYRIQEDGRINGGGGLFAAIATAATLAVGGVATVATGIGVTVVTFNPIAGFGAATVVAHGTVVAATYVAIATTCTPTP